MKVDKETLNHLENNRPHLEDQLDFNMERHHHSQAWEYL
jgi:hypothetical protein